LKLWPRGAIRCTDGVKFGMQKSTETPISAAVGVLVPKTAEHKRPAGVYPLSDFTKFSASVCSSSMGKPFEFGGFAQGVRGMRIVLQTQKWYEPPLPPRQVWCRQTKKVRGFCWFLTPLRC